MQAMNFSSGIIKKYIYKNGHVIKTKWQGVYFTFGSPHYKIRTNIGEVKFTDYSDYSDDSKLLMHN